MKKVLLMSLFFTMTFFGFSQSNKTQVLLNQAKLAGAITDNSSFSEKELLFKAEKGYRISNTVKSSANFPSISLIKHVVTGQSLNDDELMSSDFNILMYEMPFKEEQFLTFISHNGEHLITVFSNERVKTLTKREKNK